MQHAFTPMSCKLLAGIIQANLIMTHRMIRRTVLLTIARLSGATALGLALCPAQAQPTYKVSAAQLQRTVAERFPRSYPVGGLLDITLQAPRLRLLPASNRLGTVMPIEAAGPALRRAYGGTFDTEFALRYEPADRTLRAHQLRVNALRLDGLPPGQAALLEAYGPALAEQALQDAVLHQLTTQDLTLPHSMGLQPGSITVTAQGLVIDFVDKLIVEKQPP
ncbi:MAG: putative transrane protein [Polaromonas sp.]|nr:putative transrane protein [Polaromonas sp.]